MTNFTVAVGEVAANAKTLVANTEDKVTFVEDVDRIEVYSDGAAALYFTVDGSVPVVGAANCWEIPAGAKGTRDVPIHRASDQTTVVRLKSAGTPTYSVSRAD